MVLKVNHKEMQELVKEYYKSKISLMTYGTFGIGKSRVVREVAEEIAKEKKKEFIEWNKLKGQERLDLFKNPERYFVFLDIRLSSYDASDIKGLPVFIGDNKAIEFKVPLWALYITQDKSDGVTFFDEGNLAVPLVLSSVYKIVLDRCIDESKINDDWLIMMAGNLMSDRAYVTDLPYPIRDRMGEIELKVPSAELWTEWAIQNKIKSSIIGFINFKSSNLYKYNPDDEQKSVTPRSWERVSHLLKDIPDNNYSKIRLICSSGLGEGTASEYGAFVKIKDKVKIEQIIKNPEKLKEFNKPEDLGIKYFIVTALADCYREDKAKFKDIMNITEVLDALKNPEFVSLLWRLCLSYKPEFENEFVKGNTIKVANKYIKYLK